LARTEPVAIQIATGDTRSISRQIVNAFRKKIATAELGSGARVPSVRGLAQQLMVNPNTVAKAYNELTSQGWLEARPGLGLFVSAARQRLSGEERDRRLGIAVEHFVNELIALGASFEEVQDEVAQQMQAVQSRHVA
jgi:GntR family transcriptional regulator